MKFEFVKRLKITKNNGDELILEVGDIINITISNSLADELDLGNNNNILYKKEIKNTYGSMIEIDNMWIDFSDIVDIELVKVK